MRVILLVFIILLASSSFAQSVEENYQKWLETTPLSYAYEVSKYEPATGQLTLQVKEAFDHEQGVSQAYLLLDDLTQYYDSIGTNVLGILLSRLQMFDPREYTEISISFYSSYNDKVFLKISYVPLLFMGQDPLEIDVEKNYSTGRDALEIDISSLSTFDPADFLPLPASISKSRNIIRTSVFSYVKDHLNIEEDRVVIDSTNSFRHIYQVKGDGIITKSYSEEIMIKVSFHSISRFKTQVDYEVTGKYAAGVEVHGKLRPFTEEYVKELNYRFRGFISRILQILDQSE